MEAGLMRVGLLADSHDRLPAIAEFVKQMQAAGVSMVLHAGDYCAPFALRPIEEASMSLAGVFGRNDGDTQGLLAKATAGFGAELFEGPHSFELGGQRIMLVHDIADVQPRSIEAHGIVVHGFTHQQEMKHRGDTLIVNPGESCGWLYGTPKAAILDLDSRNVEFLALDPAHWTT
jgi:putative phosphoesterase